MSSKSDGLDNSKKSNNRVKRKAERVFKKQVGDIMNNPRSNNTSSKSKVKAKVVKTATKNMKYFTWARVFIFVVVASITLGVGLVFRTPIENVLNKKSNTFGDVSTFDINGLSMHFVDVGQGDSIAIRFPDSKTMLIDAGPRKSKESLINYLKTEFFAENEFVFDYVLLTHSDEDHCGGMVDVCNNFVVNKIFRPYMYSKYSKNNQVIFDETDGDATGKKVCETATYYNTIQAFNSEINSNGESAEVVKVELDLMNSSQKIEGENYYFDFYGPYATYITESAGTIENDFSPLMVLNYNGRKIMFTGDASTTSEDWANAHFELPDVDILKVGHHGSRTSSGTSFLNKIKPEISVICVGADNTYGHPKNEVLNRLLDAGSVIYRTDQNGSIVINIASNTQAKINISCGGTTISTYISVEFVIAGVILLSAIVCFGVKIKI